MQTPIYLDANATTPVLPCAATAALQVMCEAFGNPSSTHAAGLQARARMQAVRDRATRLLDAGQGQLLFVSGATEAIQSAVLSALCDVRDRRARGDAAGSVLVVGATEHKAVPESLAHWNRVLGMGLQIAVLPVGADGRHDLAALQALAPQAALVCTMAANNETGAVSDLDGIDHVLRQHAPQALWLVDGVQALGKLPLALSRRRIDYAAFSGHKLYAPKGIGLLYVRSGAPFTPLLVGGAQEDAMRAGTENLAGIAALGAVLQALEEGGTFRDPATLVRMRDRLVACLRSAFPGVVFNTPLQHALPTTINFSVPGVPSRALMDVLDAGGVQVSAGSACSAAKAAPSDVLLAMGVPAERASSAIRLSFGPATDEAWVDAACARILHCARALADAGRATPAPAEAEAPPAASAPAVADMPAFLAEHPQARIIDVREAVERLASGPVQLCGRTTAHAALSQLTQHAGSWMQEPEIPLVFVCRSGARSARAAGLLRSLGHANAWHLPGGLALQAAQAA